MQLIEIMICNDLAMMMFSAIFSTASASLDVSVLNISLYFSESVLNISEQFSEMFRNVEIFRFF